MALCGFSCFNSAKMSLSLPTMKMKPTILPEDPWFLAAVVPGLSESFRGPVSQSVRSVTKGRDTNDGHSLLTSGENRGVIHDATQRGCWNKTSLSSNGSQHRTGPPPSPPSILFLLLLLSPDKTDGFRECASCLLASSHNWDYSGIIRPIQPPCFCFFFLPFFSLHHG